MAAAGGVVPHRRFVEEALVRAFTVARRFRLWCRTSAVRVTAERPARRLNRRRIEAHDLQPEAEPGMKEAALGRGLCGTLTARPNFWMAGLDPLPN